MKAGRINSKRSDNVEEYWEMLKNTNRIQRTAILKTTPTLGRTCCPLWKRTKEALIKESIKNQQELAESTQQQIKHYEAEISKLIVSRIHVVEGSKEWYEAQAKLSVEPKKLPLMHKLGLENLKTSSEI